MSTKHEWIGLKTDEEGNRSCAVCGGIEVENVAYYDADTWYAVTYRCVKCGNSITLKADRDKESLGLWS